MIKQFKFIIVIVLLLAFAGCSSGVTDIEWGAGTYTGEVNENGNPHGQGTLYREDGTRFYEGKWEYGKRHGQGTQYYTDGTKHYVGEFKDDKWHGQGTLYAGGEIFHEGEFKRGNPDL